ncbi:MAG: apolipoprotein N-acyltransferase [Ruminococcaceae bacterium]|nr:apolipoprotein N-acyltransferase [Oscillospiraceae bacterium]
MQLTQISNKLISTVNNKYRYIFLALGGLLTGLMLVFTKLGFFEWITMIPVGIVVLVRASDRAVRLRSLYFDGLIFFYAYYLVCYHWFVYLYPLEFIDGMTKGAALAVVILAWFGLSLLQTLMGGCVFVFAGILFRCRLCERFALLRPFVAAALWAVFEWSQTIGWWGVPWGRLPIGQSKYLVGLQTASYLGSYFVTFLIVAVNFLLAYALICHTKWKRGVILAASLLVFQYGAGTLIWFTTDIEDGKAIKVACIQGNISSSDKWSDDSEIKTTEVYTRLVAKAAEEGAELVVLPETAFPYDFDSDQYAYFNKTFGDISKRYGIYVLVGAYTQEGEKDSLNSLICYAPSGERLDTVYSKQHLVPFGEYVPLRPLIETLIPPLAELVLSSDDIDAGEGANVIETGEFAIGALICFDSIYEELTYDSVRNGAELICLATNDSWFSDSAALYMHNAQAQIRAIESGRYVTRAANTGISTVITPRGEVISMLDPLVEGNVYATVYARSADTVCVHIGNTFVWILFASLIGVFADGLVNKLKTSKKNDKKA